MLAELCGVLADIGRPDQQLERAAEPAARPAMIWSWTRFCAGFISPAEIS